ncbi:MAG: LamG-like jellyroll fold domain-containing protein, partial [Flavobacteriales bacterium]
MQVNSGLSQGSASTQTGSTSMGDSTMCLVNKDDPCLIAYYPFNGNANDESGWGNHGAVFGATLTTDRFGNDSSAYEFDGVDDYIEGAISNWPLGNDSRTISLWVKDEDDNDNHTVLDYGDHGSGGEYSVKILSTLNHQIRIVENATGYDTQDSITPNKWNKVDVVYDDPEITVFLNGIKLDTFNVGSINTIDNGFFRIGRQVGGINVNFTYMKGTIDDIKVYNCALDSTQIDSIWRSECVPLRDTTDTAICQNDSIYLQGSYQTTAGTYYDTLTASNGCDSIVVTKLSTYPTYNTTVNDSICNGDSILLGGSYQTTAGTYYDTLSTVNGCDSVITTNLTVNPLPTVSLGNDTIICDGTTITLDAGAGFSTYLWSDNSTGQTLSVSDSNDYYVEVTDTNGCSNTDTITVSTTVCSGIGAKQLNPNTIELYPNPTDGKFTITSQKQVDILVFTSKGERILQKNAINGSHELDI